MIDDATATRPLAEVQRICTDLPAVTDRLSHGPPTWFVRGTKTFVMFHDAHHLDGRLAVWCSRRWARAACHCRGRRR